MGEGGGGAGGPNATTHSQDFEHVVKSLAPLRDSTSCASQGFDPLSLKIFKKSIFGRPTLKFF